MWFIEDWSNYSREYEKCTLLYNICISIHTYIISLTTKKIKNRHFLVQQFFCPSACCWHFLASLLKIDYKSIISNGTRNVGCWYTITIVMSER